MDRSKPNLKRADHLYTKAGCQKCECYATRRLFDIHPDTESSLASQLARAIGLRPHRSTSVSIIALGGSRLEGKAFERHTAYS